MTQEVLKLALEALEELYNTNNYWWQEVDEQTLEKIKYSITTIKEALALQALHSENERLGLYKDAYAQPEQEPSGHFLDFAYSDSIAYVHVYDQFRKGQQFYKAPPQRTWVGLTDEEISELSKGHIVRSTYARAIEAKLKERNDHSI